MRQFITNVLGHNVGGLTEDELLGRFTEWYMSVYCSWFDAELDVQFRDTLRRMRLYHAVEARFDGNRDAYVHRPVLDNWLMWAKERQDAEAATA
jgi:hypothetical protein